MENLKAVASRLARLAVMAALLVAFSTTAHAQDSEQKKEKAHKKMGAQKQMKRDAATPQNLVSTLEARGNFSALVGALKKTGLAKQLQQSDQQYTLFAPTDEAFAQLPEGTLDSMSKDQLAGLLRRHLVPGAMASADALRKGRLASVQGANLTVEKGASGATVNGSAIVEADIEAGNGVIHVIDSVLMPKQSKSMSGDAGAPETPDDTEEGAGGSR